MNEYIILHRAKDLGTLLKVLTIHEFGIKNTLEGERNFVRFKDITKEDFLCNESPAEIEALIMGSPLNSNEFKYSHFALPSITANEDPIDYLSDKVNRLIYELEKLEKENAQLKETLSNTRKQLEMMVKYSKDRFHSMEHSSPENPCCRETYSKLHEALCTVSREDRLDLINWDQSFIDAIRENKNVQQPKGNKND